MLTLKTLIFSGIGRFVEEQTIDFTVLGSLVQIDGQNNNTGGSSGSGKSTIFNALDFLLGLNNLSNGVLQSRLTKESMSVTGIFDFNGLPLKIQRSKKLLIDLNGEVTTGSSKLTEEKLDQILGMPRDLFRKILHKRQGERGWFLEMGPTDIHKFLTDCLGLQKELAKIEKLDFRLADLENGITATQSSIESNTAALDATAAAISSLGGPPALEIDQSLLESLKTAHTVAINNHKSIKDSHKKEASDLDAIRPVIAIAPFDRSKLEAIESVISVLSNKYAELNKEELLRQSAVKAKISELQSGIVTMNSAELMRQSEVKNKISALRLELSKLQREESDRKSEVQRRLSTLESIRTKAQGNIDASDRAKEEAVKLAEELKKVRASICPKCQQNWITESIKLEESNILLKLQEHKKSVMVGTEAKNVLALTNEDIRQLQNDLLDRPIPALDVFTFQFKQLESDLQPQPISGLSEVHAEIAILKWQSDPQISDEMAAIDGKIKSHQKEWSEAREEERSHQHKESERSRNLATKFAQEQNELKLKHESAAKTAQDEENRSFNEYESAKNKVVFFQEAKTRFEENLGKLKAQQKEYKNVVDVNQGHLDLLKEEVELVNESKKAIKSYLSCSFDDALESIGDSATRFIRAIPNMATATIQFESLKENQNGKVKEEVNCVISMDGEVGIPVKSLSGGERSSADLAIDMAAIKFIEERTGLGISVMELDEPFTGLDSKNIMEALEVLKECSSDKQLLITDHNPEASQSIENKLIVIRDGLTSRVVQQ